MRPPQLEFVAHVETSDESLRWLMLSLFVATAAPGTGRVELDFFRVL